MGYLVEYIKQRVLKENKNFLACVVGPTGSGKSYSSLRLAQELNPELSTKELMKNIVFNPEGFMRVVRSKPKKGTVIVYEEAGVTISNRNWQSLVNKMINYVLQTFRKDNLVVLFTVPDFDFIDSQTRKLFHGLFEMIKIDKRQKKGILKPKFLQTNVSNGKQFQKFLRVRTNDGIMTLSRVGLSLPDAELIKEYEKKKNKFTSDLNQEIGSSFNKKRLMVKLRKLSCIICGHDWKQRNPFSLPKKCPNCESRRWNNKELIEKAPKKVSLEPSFQVSQQAISNPIIRKSEKMEISPMGVVQNG